MFNDALACYNCPYEAHGLASEFKEQEEVVTAGHDCDQALTTLGALCWRRNVQHFADVQMLCLPRGEVVCLPKTKREAKCCDVTLVTPEHPRNCQMSQGPALASCEDDNLLITLKSTQRSNRSLIPTKATPGPNHDCGSPEAHEIDSASSRLIRK